MGCCHSFARRKLGRFFIACSVFFALGLINVSTGLAQGRLPSSSSIHKHLGDSTDLRATSRPETPALSLTVYDQNHAPINRQAVVKVTNRASKDVLWQTTQDKSVASFSALGSGEYDVEVSAVGYLTTRQQVTLSNEGGGSRLDLVLSPDPQAVDIADSSDRRTPANIRKELRRALQQLQAEKMDEARATLGDAYQKAPLSSELNFLLGYIAFQKNDLARSEAYLSAATKLDPQNLQALTLLGRLYLQNKNYDLARVKLEESVQADSANWIAHALLAAVYLKQNQTEKAKNQADLAIEKGKGVGYAAQLLRAEALTQLGQSQAAIQALQAYLQDDSSGPTATQARKRIAELQSSESARTQDRGLDATGIDQMLTASYPTPVLQSWHPVGVDESKPAVVPGVACPYENVIQQAGERVKELVDGLAKFDATETMLHQDLDEFGSPRTNVSLKFDYLASIRHAKPGVLLVDEYRTWHSQAEDFPDHIATRGLPALAFVFHPDVRDNFEMNCEGLGTWNGAATWLMHFQQREDKPHHTQEYLVNGRVFPVSVKGRAWIAADSFQIVRLESDLVRPIPQILLFSQHWSVDYGPVHFAKQDQDLWLPKNAELYFNFMKHRYFRRHTFDHFMLFSVDTEEKRKEPKPALDPGPA